MTIGDALTLALIKCKAVSPMSAVYGPTLRDMAHALLDGRYPKSSVSVTRWIMVNKQNKIKSVKSNKQLFYLSIK